MVRNIALHYFADPYISFARAAEGYRGLLEQAGRSGLPLTISNQPDEADIIVLHCRPHLYPEMFRQHPYLSRKYVIGNCCWEADMLPDEYIKGISLMKRLWTCSAYCKRVFDRYHPSVSLMPHVTSRDVTTSDDAYRRISNLIIYNPDNTYFLCIGRLDDKRKNLSWLIKLFTNIAHAMPRARLIVKCGPNDNVRQSSAEKIIYIPYQLTDEEINALYAISSIFVSAHHSEGWGYCISDAMLFDKPIVATGYSGNLDYMDASKTMLAKYKEQPIDAEDEFDLFTKKMQWAYPDAHDFAALLQQAYLSYQRKTQHRAKHEGIRSVEPFSVQGLVCKMINEMRHVMNEKDSMDCASR